MADIITKTPKRCFPAFEGVTNCVCQATHLPCTYFEVDLEERKITHLPMRYSHAIASGASGRVVIVANQAHDPMKGFPPYADQNPSATALPAVQFHQPSSTNRSQPIANS